MPGGGVVAEPPAGFAAMLRGLRREAQWTQEELAEAAGKDLEQAQDLHRDLGDRAGPTPSSTWGPCGG